jgi:uncharacterized protein (DUF2147 family)
MDFERRIATVQMYYGSLVELVKAAGERYDRPTKPRGRRPIMKRYLSVVFVVAVIFWVPPATAGDGDAIVGVWATDPEGGGGQAHIEIYANGDRYDGKIVWLEEPLYTEDDEGEEPGVPKEDHNNPDPALRSRPIIGLVLMQGFVYDGKGTWIKGTIYDPDNGKTYKSKVRFGDDDGVLRVRGFIGISMLGRTSEWTRVESGG